jgi:glutaredoxin
MRPLINKKIIVSTVLFLVAFGGSLALLIKNKAPSREVPRAVPETVVLNETSTAANKPVASQERQPAVATSAIILFYGNGCPHCALVEQFVAENNIQSKVPFTQKEVYYNKQNANELALKAAACGLPTNSIGVPFLWTGSTCIIGDQPVIDFFKQKTGIQ